jgi:hypothetical protein
MAYLSNNLIMAKDAAEHERQLLMAKALRYYDGDEPKDILKVKKDGPDDNVSVNYSETIVDKGVSFLFGDELDIEIGGEKDETGEKYLNEVWPEDDRHTDLIDLGTNGGVFGHAWLKIVLENGKPRPSGAVQILDPLNMSAEWDAHDGKRVTRYRNQYNTTDENGNPIIWREDTERDGLNWIVKEYYSKPDSASWVLVSSEPWRWPFAPVFECKNLPKPNEFYGRADLSKYVLSITYYIARVDSLINKIIRAHAGPKPVAKGLKAQDLKIGIDDVLFLPDKDAVMELLEMTGDLAGAMAFRKQLREALSEVSHVPEVATGKLESVGQLSGLALKILYGPLLDQTSKKRRLYGKLIKHLVKALLVVGGKKEQDVTLNWPNALPGDDLTSVQIAEGKKRLGVSEDTLMRELGYDPETEREKRELDSEDMATTMLDKFARGE